MKLTAQTYDIVKESRENLAKSLAEIDVGSVPGITQSEIAMLRNRLQNMDAMLREYERRKAH